MSVPELTAKIFTAIILGVAEKATGIIPDEITKPIKEVLGTGSNVIIKSGAEVIKGVGGIFKIGTDAGIDILDGLIGSPKKKDD